jgi:hypothetical protein
MDKTRLAVLVLMASVSCLTCAQAFDLTGLWATDSEACDKIFETKNKKSSFRKDSDLYGGGFIVEGSRVRGRMARCNVKSSKQNEDTIHMMLGCATDIMLQNVQFSVKVVDDNRVIRFFPGVDGMELGYVRCPSKP